MVGGFEDFDVVRVVVIVEILESSGADVVFGAVVVVEGPGVDVNVTFVDTKDFVVVGGGAILVDLDVATFVVWGGFAVVLGGAAALVDLCLGGVTFGGLGAGFGLAFRSARSSGVEDS